MLTLKEDLSSKAEDQAIWRSEWPRAHVTASLLDLLIGAKVDLPPLRSPEPGRGPCDVLERMFLTWRETGRWPDGLPPEDLDRLVAGVNDRTSPDDRAALVALATITGDEARAAAARAKLMTTQPRGGITSDIDVMVVSRPDLDQTLQRLPEVKSWWTYEICAKTSLGFGVAPMVTLAAWYTEQTKAELGAWLREGLAQIDSDLTGQGNNVRLGRSKNYEAEVVRKPDPGVHATIRIEGEGSLIGAATPALLHDQARDFVLLLMNVLGGAPIGGRIKRARSRPDVIDLLSDAGASAVFNVGLTGGLSIEPGALGAFRTWFDTGIGWVKGCFPEVKAAAEVVALPPEGGRK
jgi:hypothetical protein